MVGGEVNDMMVLLQFAVWCVNVIERVLLQVQRC